MTSQARLEAEALTEEGELATHLDHVRVTYGSDRSNQQACYAFEEAVYETLRAIVAELRQRRSGAEAVRLGTLADDVLSMVFAFDSNDDRRERVRELARAVQGVEERVRELTATNKDLCDAIKSQQVAPSPSEPAAGGPEWTWEDIAAARDWLGDHGYAAATHHPEGAVAYARNVLAPVQKQLDELRAKLDGAEKEAGRLRSELGRWTHMRPTPTQFRIEEQRAEKAEAERDALKVKVTEWEARWQASEQKYFRDIGRPTLHLDALQASVTKAYETIIANRERYLEAFVAETGAKPSELVIEEARDFDGEKVSFRARFVPGPAPVVTGGPTTGDADRWLAEEHNVTDAHDRKMMAPYLSGYARLFARPAEVKSEPSAWLVRDKNGLTVAHEVTLGAALQETRGTDVVVPLYELLAPVSEPT